MTDQFSDLMRRATQLTQAGRLTQATALLQQALGGGAAADQPVAPARPAPAGMVLDGCVFEIDRPAAQSAVAAASSAPLRDDRRVAPVTAGEFSAGNHRHAGQTLGYKLYTPPGPLDGHRPLLVMLHGCTQNPDDFAAGTGMNRLAAERGFFVLYPAQSQAANASRCWNWFDRQHQQRDHGEPALITSLTRAVMAIHAIDERRVFVAGLSAGGAMAALVAAVYPEIYAAVGVHSGLPCGAARDLPSALAVMKKGANASAAPGQPVPTIVFHGDQDRTVHARNGEQVIAAALAGSSTTVGLERGVSAAGQKFTRSIHRSPAGQPVAEHWLVHGGAHAWSGGRATGSFTNPKGPDASLAMLDFFAANPKAGQR